MPWYFALKNRSPVNFNAAFPPCYVTFLALTVTIFSHIIITLHRSNSKKFKGFFEYFLRWRGTPCSAIIILKNLPPRSPRKGNFLMSMPRGTEGMFWWHCEFLDRLLFREAGNKRLVRGFPGLFWNWDFCWLYVKSHLWLKLNNEKGIYVQSFVFRKLCFQNQWVYLKECRLRVFFWLFFLFFSAHPPGLVAKESDIPPGGWKKRPGWESLPKPRGESPRGFFLF